jgi:hypothetical protein
MSKSDQYIRSLFDEPEPESDPVWGNRLNELARERGRMNEKPYGRQDRPTQPESVVFDIDQARAERDAAIDRSDANASPTWKEAFYVALVHVATSEERFTADEVWERLAQLPHVPNTVDNRAAGGVIVRASRRGIIKLTNITKPSRRKHCHAMLQRVYQSCVVGKRPSEIPAYG